MFCLPFLLLLSVLGPLETGRFVRLKTKSALVCAGRGIENRGGGAGGGGADLHGDGDLVGALVGGAEEPP